VGGYQNETYLQFKPLLSSIQTSVPISMITEPTYTGLNLVSKNYVDGAIAGASSSVQNKIQTTVDNNDRMTM
jgi:phosphotransacetylase